MVKPGGFFAQNLRKKYRPLAKKEERKKEKKKYHLAEKKDNTVTTDNSGKSRSSIRFSCIRLSYTSFINKVTRQNGTVFRATRKRGDDAVWREYDEYYYEE